MRTARIRLSSPDTIAVFFAALDLGKFGFVDREGRLRDKAASGAIALIALLRGPVPIERVSRADLAEQLR
jgi:hypothetical protein